MYSIKQLADLGGVTTRTLRFYDQQGILNPAQIGENGYRYYDQNSLLRLQQVLFFRELDVPLKEIQSILDQPDYDPLQILQQHHQALTNQVERFNTLLATLEKTILSLQGEQAMADQEYFKGFDESRYEEEARERWGQTPKYLESQRKWSSYSPGKKEQIKQEGGSITVRMVPADPRARPDDPDVQQAVADYYAYLNEHFYSCEVEFLRNLADMWVEDPRFAVNYERIREGGAAFVREAVQIYCDRCQT